MITGAHSIIYSTDAVADRAFYRDLLKLPYVDVGDGWLIFELPPAEVAVHPSASNNVHELFLMCDDIAAFRVEMSEYKIPCSELEEMPWGLLTRMTLPGGGSIGVDQPRHERPTSVA